jgi:hypothetical protein
MRQMLSNIPRCILQPTRVGEKFDHAVRIIIINRLDNMAVTSWFYIMDYFYIKVVRKFGKTVQNSIYHLTQFTW